LKRLGVAALAVGLLGVVIGVAGFITLARDTTPVASLGPPHFVEETGGSGLQHTYDGNFSFATGGGVAAFDCNDDGKPELLLAGGTNGAALFINDSVRGGALRFSRRTSPVTDLRSVTGVYPLDIDGDGKVDLAVLRAGGNELLRGIGECRFERANERWSFAPGSGLSTAFTATWEGANRMPTVAIGNYLKLAPSGETTMDCDANALYRPSPGASSYQAPVTLEPGYCALSMLFSDWDRSGRKDLRVSNDRQYYDYVNGEEQLWRISDGAPRTYTAADGWVQLQIWGMGIATYDVTGDGYPDVYLTNQGPNKLQTLSQGPSAPTYRDIGLKRGADAAKPFVGTDVALASTAWHPEFQDVNNDGFVDLLVTKGNVDEQPDYARADPSNLLLGRPDGTFRESAIDAGIVNFARGRGAAVVDLNLDGLLDVVEVNYRDPVRVWRNVGGGSVTAPAPMGHWLAVALRQDGPNRAAVGAWIEVRIGERILRREVTVGGGHAGGQFGWLHFGLGPSGAADVRVQWPDGQTGPWLRAQGDGFAIITRGASTIEPWKPAG
jgi:enediyne biosynthesis protein E4